ncbi:hypothetical protein SAMN06297251_1121 [Fulvimarina manganoxydans]|uniref:Uncharacterized protein n=1 Tax=Fulvimarina manganoxydans TaxID=937218 RepID=A0A1W2CZ07_9HYPH|nr:hypothetical protein [Fulvimarina manganoxydans]SMC90545.1 hypothetical protein SAMN06297251_1121 [Fulvimarina manganoxydans]
MAGTLAPLTSGGQLFDPNEGWEHPEEAEPLSSRKSSSLPPVAPPPLPELFDRLAPLTGPRKQRAKSVTPEEVIQVFNRAFDEVHGAIPNVVRPQWGENAAHKIRSALMKPWKDGTKTEESGQELLAFVDWFVREWGDIRGVALRFRTQRPAPEFPTVGFLLSARAREPIVDYWNGRATADWTRSMPAGKRRRLEELTRKKGLSREEALVQFGKEQSAEENERKMAEVRQQADDATKRAAYERRNWEAERRTLQNVPDIKEGARRLREQVEARARGRSIFASRVHPVSNSGNDA